MPFRMNEESVEAVRRNVEKLNDINHRASMEMAQEFFVRGHLHGPVTGADVFVDFAGGVYRRVARDGTVLSVAGTANDMASLIFGIIDIYGGSKAVGEAYIAYCVG